MSEGEHEDVQFKNISSHVCTCVASVFFVATDTAKSPLRFHVPVYVALVTVIVLVFDFTV